MNKMVRIFVLSGVGTIAVLCALLWFDRHRAPEWPHFPEAHGDAGSKPQMLVEYDEPFDFGYRTGNLIPVDIVVKVPAGTSIEEGTLAMQGDMQLVKKQTERGTAADGTCYYRFRLKLQNFVYKPKLTGTASLSYRMDGDTVLHRLQSEDIEIYPSKTFDGRKMGHPKDPVLHTHQGYHALLTLAMLVGGLSGMVLCLWQPWRKRNAVAEPLPAPPASDPFVTAGAAYDVVCSSESASRDQVRELVRALRAAYNVPEVTYGYMLAHADERQWYDALGNVLRICEDASVWADRNLTGDELEKLRSLRGSLFGLPAPA